MQIPAQRAGFDFFKGQWGAPCQCINTFKIIPDQVIPCTYFEDERISFISLGEFCFFVLQDYSIRYISSTALNHMCDSLISRAEQQHFAGHWFDLTLYSKGAWPSLTTAIWLVRFRLSLALLKSSTLPYWTSTTSPWRGETAQRLSGRQVLNTWNAL